MSDNKSLIDLNLGELSKPATVLVEKISDAVGVLYEPKRIVKRAEAEAKADKIKALASIELSDIEQRGIDRLVHQEARKQENIEAITAQAIESLSDDAKAEGIDEDWIAHFFKTCDTVSDKEMQSLWAKILSGEATNSGTFSKRTVNFVASMDISDAKLFTEFCQFCWFIGEYVPFILDVNNDIYLKKGISFDSLNHLTAIGLINVEHASNFKKVGFSKKIIVSYFNRPVTIEFKNENELMNGKAFLTSAGQELASICGAHRNEEFYNYIISGWSNDKNITLS